MKHPFPYLAVMLGLAAAFPVANASDEAAPAPKQATKEIHIISTPNDSGASGGPRIERRVIFGHPGKPGEMETVTFLGVETAPVSPTLTTQLGLPEGTGLVVSHLASESPAAGVLKEHDILLKLDDQLLIEQRQLSVLVRNHKEGDEVTLTYLRGGKQASVKVKLAKHDVPKVAMQLGAAATLFGAGGGGSGGSSNTFGKIDVMVLDPNNPQDRESVERMLPLMDGAKAPGLRIYREAARPEAGPGENNISVRVNTGNSHMVLDDDKGSIELTLKDRLKELVAKNAKGEQVFSGPVNTPEERKALPADVRERLERLEDSTQLGYKPGSDFTSETKVIRPRGQSIALPPQPAAPARPPLFY